MTQKDIDELRRRLASATGDAPERLAVVEEKLRELQRLIELTHDERIRELQRAAHPASGSGGDGS